MFELSKELKEGLISYKKNLEETLKGKMSQARFKGIRVPWGIYSHRGGETYMTRVRVPAGTISAEQLKALANASKLYGNGILHLTTRQDIQIHSVMLQDTVKVMKDLEKAGLSPRGGGGNTVRNILSCISAGVCGKEAFDVRGDVVSITENLLNEESSFFLPRKYKIAFAGCSLGWRTYMLNDVGFMAEIKDGDKGYKVFVGGGMGASSRVGQLLEEFIPKEQAEYVVTAIKNIFNTKGDRKDKHHNRLRFLIEELGFEEFKKLYRAEMDNLLSSKKVSSRCVSFFEKPENNGLIAQGEGLDYQDFIKNNVHPQKQAGYSSVDLRIGRGDIPADRLLDIANLDREFGGIEFRTTQDQNLVLCWIKNQDLFKLFNKLKEKTDEFLYPGTLLDVVSCKGASTCNLGICNTPALALELEKMIKEEFTGKKVFEKLSIRINGCPNACAQHPLGKISFYGIVKKIDNRPVPFYKLLLGSRMIDDKVKLAEEVGMIPARNMPKFLKELLSAFDDKLETGIELDEFLGNEAKNIARKIIQKFSFVPKYEEDRTFYIDWGKTTEFSLAGIGPGECGTGVLDMIDSDLKDAKNSLENLDLYRALIFSARALLVVKGIETSSDGETLVQFKEKFVETGIVAYKFKDISEAALSILKNEIDIDEAKKYIEELYSEVFSAYKGMDGNFSFPIRREIENESKSKKVAETEIEPKTHLMDLRGVKCPINYVKAKMRLENMEKGEKLLLYLDPDEPIKNVPVSLRNDGQDVMKIEEKDNYFEVLVKKEN